MCARTKKLYSVCADFHMKYLKVWLSASFSGRLLPSFSLIEGLYEALLQWLYSLYMIVSVPVMSLWHSVTVCYTLDVLHVIKFTPLHSLLLSCLSASVGSRFISVIPINRAEKKPKLHFKDSAGCQQLAGAIKKPLAGYWWCICSVCACTLKVFSSGANWILFQHTNTQQCTWNKINFRF